MGIGHGAVRAGALAILVTGLSCGGDDGADQAGDTSADRVLQLRFPASSTGIAEPTLLDAFVAYCPKAVVCGIESKTLAECLQGAYSGVMDSRFGYLLGKVSDRDAYECNQKATSCEAVVACFAGEACTDLGFRCEGSVLAHCDEYMPGSAVVYREDCAKASLVCDASAGACVPAVAACAPGEGEWQCHDGYTMRCRDDGAAPHTAPWKVPGTRCANTGQVCGATSGVCVDAPASSCVADRCDGKLISRCADGETSSFDCSVVGPGFVCFEPSGASGPGPLSCGLAAAPECPLPTTDTDKAGAGRDAEAQRLLSGACEGETAVVCVNGKRVEIDCAALNLTCVEGAAGAGCVAPGGG